MAISATTRIEGRHTGYRISAMKPTAAIPSDT